MPVESVSFGAAGDQTITLFKLANRAGNLVKLMNFGAILVSLEFPDKHGNLQNVNLGYPNLDSYLQRHPYLGSVVGRFCNRIAAGRFELAGNSYALAVNDGPNHLHGGTNGFDRLIWNAEPYEAEHDCGVRMWVVSPEGQEGYPGELRVEVHYSWNDENEFSYIFEASSTAPTVVNLTNHAYWNLGGANSGSIRDHEVKLNCDQYLVVDDTLIPTGEIASVAETALDFREFRRLGERLDSLTATKGYDHCYVVNGPAGVEPRTCGIARDPQSGRSMEVLTTQPGMQLYTGNHLGGGYQPYSGFCMETQHYPDSPNKPNFPTTRLDPGQVLREQTIHRFSVT